MDTGTRDKWNRIYSIPADVPPAPMSLLSDWQHLLPQQGCALDLACGRGANGWFLAERGMECHFWDIADEAVTALLQRGKEAGLQVQGQACDLVATPLPENRFDVIVVCHYLERRLSRDLIHALRPGGLLFYQTFTRHKTGSAGPDKKDFLLDENELLTLFGRDLTVRYYHEEGRCGDQSKGLRGKAQLIAQRPA